MPLPKPKSDEQREEFIRRCMGDSVMKSEYPNNAQRLAICAVQWRNK
jgi:hypothetical protein